LDEGLECHRFCFVLALGLKLGAWQLGIEMPFGQKGHNCDCKAVKQLKTKNKKQWDLQKHIGAVSKIFHAETNVETFIFSKIDYSFVFCRKGRIIRII